ncbi:MULTISPECIES: hypothetical protein [unclassified Paenibacillus]|uniref:hypothetical protein n=1 Tax=unclassified Paenibacillus TaxID=185978 RepID=UPI003631CC8B
MKTSISRISYYVRKVNAYNLARFDFIRCRSAKQPPASRPLRLLAYKAAMYRRIHVGKGVAL